MEEWISISGYDGVYEISNDGHARRTKTGRILANIVGENGYVRVHLCSNGQRRKILMHRLVAIHFVPNPENKPEVNHEDGNKQNNYYKNLTWSTGLENKRHARENNLTCKGERNVKNKLTSEQVNELRKLYEYRTLTQKQLGEKYGIGQSTISAIIRKKLWNHI